MLAQVHVDADAELAEAEFFVEPQRGGVVGVDVNLRLGRSVGVQAREKDLQIP